MTDINPSTAAAPSRDVTRTEFKGESIWLPRLSVEHLNAGHDAIRGKTFTECLIEGPAVMLPAGDVVFEDCHMGTAAKPQNLLLSPVGDLVTGAIGLVACRFVRCRFLYVGFVGNEAFREMFAAGVPSLTSLKETGQ
jgi:hypothetical protein